MNEWVYVLYPFAFIGFLFTTLVIVGLIRNGLQSGISLDQWLGTCLIAGHMADETISAWAHRGHHYKTEMFINCLFRNPNHCAQAYVSEMLGTQNAPEYERR